MTNNNEDIASRLRKRITIQKPVQQADGAGGQAISWTDFATVWAEIIPRRATEEFFAGGLANRSTHKITIRFLAVINATMRINFADRIFNILSILNTEERNITLELMVEEVKK